MSEDLAMTRDVAQNKNLQENLQYLCSYYPTVSEICRRIGINRQQFYKYIGGHSRPSPYNMKKICDFFGIEEFEILYPTEKLRAVVDLKGLQPKPGRREYYVTETIKQIYREMEQGFENYYGYYYKHYHSFSYPGHILKGLLFLYDYEGFPHYKCIERLVDRTRTVRFGYVYKYVGIALFLRDRIFMVDREVLTGNEISETILYPSYKNKIGDLPGLMIGSSGRSSREPMASRVLLEYLGSTVNVRAVMHECGLFPLDSPQISASVKAAIRNSVDERGIALRAEPPAQIWPRG